MVARNNRGAPLPDVARTQVADGVVQRALEGITTALIEIIKFLQPFKQPEKWMPLPLQPTWDTISLATLGLPSAQAPQYRKDPFGRVFLRGILESAAPTNVVAVLPLGYRPPEFVASTAFAGGVLQRNVAVFNDGRVFVVTPTSVVSLDGISFDTVT